MINPIKHTNVDRGVRRHKRTSALLATAGAMVILLAGHSARGDDALAAPATQPSMVSGGVASDGTLHLAVGKTTIINLRRMYKTIDVGDNQVIAWNINKNDPSSFLVTAKKPGTTAILILDDDNHSSVISVVVDPDLALLERQIKLSFPASSVTVSPLNDSIALRGQVPSVSVAEQVVEMASTYAKVHNFLEISGGQQVMLQVRIAEVSKSALRDLGVTFGGTDGLSTFSTAAIGPGANTFTFPAPLGASPLTYSVGSANIFGTGAFKGIGFDYLITAMRTNNLLRDLAEPNLLTTSGQEANFLAGGQIPIPVPQPGNGGSTITIQYVSYGVQLKFTPNVLGNGKIRLHVAPEVSQLDYAHAVTVSGTSVPGFTDRKLDTTVELGDGQSLALAGLLQNDLSSSVTSIPGLGDLPVLGALFRSTSYSRDETELVVMVTPRLQAPMNPDQVPLLPGEHYRYPNTLQQFLFADLGGTAVEKSKLRADKKSAGVPPQFHGTYGFTEAATGSVLPTGNVTAPAK
jgi:pilus assembly protein CpaC